MKLELNEDLVAPAIVRALASLLDFALAYGVASLIGWNKPIVMLVYFAVFESSGMHSTPIKWCFGYRVVNERGGTISYFQALYRQIIKVIGCLFLFVGFLMLLFSKKRKTLHDWLAKTNVIDIHPEDDIEEDEVSLVRKSPELSYRSHTATVLQNGHVLLVTSGGAEIFDPKKQEFYYPDSPGFNPGVNLATLLLDGRVLVVSFGPKDSRTQAKIYNPHKDSWKSVNHPVHRYRQGQLTLLANGQVLATGGAVSVGPPKYVVGDTSCEVWDPTTGDWTETQPFNHARYDHYAVALPDGSVVVIGGPTKAIEQRLPDGTWHEVAELPNNLYDHQVVLLKDDILIIGGRTMRPSEAYAPVNTQSSSWLLQLKGFKLTSAGQMLKPRSWMKALLLPNEKVMVLGGTCESAGLETTEYWSLENREWDRGPSMSAVRYGHTASLLGDGSVFVIGGDFSESRTSEIVIPETEPSIT